MCFGGGGNSGYQPTPQQDTPAPAPPPPAPVAEEVDVKGARKAEDRAQFGPTGVPNLRVDRSVTSGGSTAGGTGIRM